MDLCSIIKELELAKGADRVLDRAIACVVGWQRKNGDIGEDDYWKWGDWSWTREDSEHPPRYTASLESALSLVPENWNWIIDRMWFGLATPNHRPFYTAVIRSPDADYEILPAQGGFESVLMAGIDASGIQRTDSSPAPALAVCIAALRAKHKLDNAAATALAATNRPAE